jgi:hypothetical protein
LRIAAVVMRHSQVPSRVTPGRYRKKMKSLKLS